MPKVNAVSEIEVDEISLVDRPANQHASVVLAKRAPQEETFVADNYFTEDGSAVDIDSLEPGAIVYDESGDAFRIEVDEPELATVGKSAFLEAPAADPVSKSIADSLRQE